MRLFAFIVFLLVNLLHHKTCNAQVVPNGPGTFVWVNAVPTFNPGTWGAKFAVNVNTFEWYEWVSGTSWVESGDRIQRISGCSAPAYTPTIHQAHVVINGCTSPNIPEIYAWTGSSWVKLNPSGGATYTAGTGIAISGDNVISADTSILATQYDISQLGVSFPLLAPTSTTPQYSFLDDPISGIYYNNGLNIITGQSNTLDAKEMYFFGSENINPLGNGGQLRFESGSGVISGGSMQFSAGASEHVGGNFSMIGGLGANTKGGDINVYSGESYSGAGGNINLIAEGGPLSGGMVFIRSGGGNVTGAITIQTGTSGEIEPIVTESAGIQYKGFTTTQRNALTGVTAGRVLWNSTLSRFNQHDGTRWYEIPKNITASATLDFPSTAAHSNSDLTATVTGAAVGDAVDVSPPVAAILTRSCYTAWVSAVNTVTVRFNNYNTAAAADPASATFNVIVTKF